MSILKFLTEPFPDSNDFRNSIKGDILVGGIVYIVLLFVLPLDITEAPSSIYLNCAYYAGITIVVSMLFNFVMIYVLKFDRETPSWTLWKWIVQTVLMIGMIALANILFTSYFFEVPIDWQYCLNLISITFTIGLFPVALTGIITVFRKKKLYTNLAETISSEIKDQKHQASPSTTIQEITFQSGSTSITLDASQILIAKSLQNYVQLYYNQAGSITVETVRKTLTNLESVLSPYGIERCHRSYLVNRSKIQSITGNAQGLKLSFEGVDEIVAVSRKYVDAFRK